MDESISTHELTDAWIRCDRLSGSNRTLRFAGYMNDLQTKIKVFEAAIWFPKLQAVVNDTDSRGLSGTLRGIKVSIWCCAGRCLIQFERPDTRLTLITADTEKPWWREVAHQWPNMGPMGLQSVEGYYPKIMVMFYEVTRYWDELTLAPDDNVTWG